MGRSDQQAGPSGFHVADDYIPFDFDDAEDNNVRPPSAPATAVEEAEQLDGSTDSKGKRKRKRTKDRFTASRDQSPEHGGSKERRTEERRDRGIDKSQYQTPAQRKRERRQNSYATPWCDSVDFDRCSNAAEM